jgi:hypothetical protein
VLNFKNFTKQKIPARCNKQLFRPFQFNTTKINFFCLKFQFDLYRVSSIDQQRWFTVSVKSKRRRRRKFIDFYISCEKNKEEFLCNRLQILSFSERDEWLSWEDYLTIISSEEYFFRTDWINRLTIIIIYLAWCVCSLYKKFSVVGFHCS